MSKSKNNISIKDNKNIIKQKIIITKYLSTEEEFNLKLEQSANNMKNNINKNIILKLKKKNLKFKILSIFLKSKILILLIILSIILHSNIYNLFQNKKNNKTNILIIDENNNKTKNVTIQIEKKEKTLIIDKNNNIKKDNIPIIVGNRNNTKIDIIQKEMNLNSSIFDIVYNDIIFKNYISGDFFSKFSNNKTIFYVKTHNLDNQAWRVTKNYTVLITHNSDGIIDSSKFNKFLQCGKFKYWFAQNPIINEPRLFTLPIGLMNKEWHKYPRFNLMMKEKKKNIKPTKLLLLSFSIRNNKNKRQQCADSFINKSYVTNNVAYKVKNFIGDVKEYDRMFFNIMLDHLFIACPEGNGIDTHRFWETLYMGRYPVALHNRVNDAFNDLPVLILNKWEDFDKEYLMFLKRIKNKEFSYKKLTQEYWIDRINNLE